MTRGGTFAVALFPDGGVFRTGLQPSGLNEACVPGSVPGHCPGVGRAHLAQAGLPTAHLNTQASSNPSRCPCFYSRSASPQPGTPAKAKASLETLTRRGRGEAGRAVFVALDFVGKDTQAHPTNGTGQLLPRNRPFRVQLLSPATQGEAH